MALFKELAFAPQTGAEKINIFSAYTVCLIRETLRCTVELHLKYLVSTRDFFCPIKCQNRLKHGETWDVGVPLHLQAFPLL